MSRAGLRSTKKQCLHGVGSSTEEEITKVTPTTAANPFQQLKLQLREVQEEINTFKAEQRVYLEKMKLLEAASKTKDARIMNLRERYKKLAEIYKKEKTQNRAQKLKEKRPDNDAVASFSALAKAGRSGEDEKVSLVERHLDMTTFYLADKAFISDFSDCVTNKAVFERMNSIVHIALGGKHVLASIEKAHSELASKGVGATVTRCTSAGCVEYTVWTPNKTLHSTKPQPAMCFLHRGG